MIIDLRNVREEPQSLQFSLDRTWWRSDLQDDQVLGLDAPLEVKAVIYRAGDKFLLEGEFSGGFQLRCDRCLEPYHQDLKSTFNLFLTLAEPVNEFKEVELLDQDLAVEFIKGQEIDLGNIVKEQVFLSMPMKTICSEDCSGLCSKCGGNIKRRECRCKREAGHPAFSILEKLKKTSH